MAATHPAPGTYPVPAPTRTNEDLNLAVLRRHDPSITSILSLAQYAVVYLFNATTQLWEKIGIEGTLFVCQLTQGDLGEERYSVFVLNRRGMNNFETKLYDGGDIEITDEYVILKVDGHDNVLPVTAGGAGAGLNHDDSALRTGPGGKSIIYGLWIFSEPASSTAEARALNAQVIKECAVHAGESKKFAQERLAAERSQNVSHNHPIPRGEPTQGGVPMGRQISLKELFGQQRAQDDEWSVKAHSPAVMVNEPGTGYPMPPQNVPLRQGSWPANTTIPGGNQQNENDVLNLLRKATMSYQ